MEELSDELTAEFEVTEEASEALRKLAQAIDERDPIQVNITVSLQKASDDGDDESGGDSSEPPTDGDEPDDGDAGGQYDNGQYGSGPYGGGEAGEVDN